MQRKIYIKRKIFASFIIVILAAIALFLSPFLVKFGLSALIIAVILGAIIANTSKNITNTIKKSGILGICTKEILRLGIILYGFQITLQDALNIGIGGILSAFIIVFSSFLFGVFICKKLGLDNKLAVLMSCGASICGAAALMGAQNIVKANPNIVAIALCTVVIFGSLGMFIYPFALSGLEEAKAGFIIGASLHEVAHVAGASAFSQIASTNAIIIKMLRVLMLAPFLIFLSLTSVFFINEKSSLKTNFPYFALWFFVCLLCSGFISKEIKEIIYYIDIFLLCAAMCALGLTITKAALKNASIKAFIAAGLIFIWLIMLSFILCKIFM